MKTQIFVQARLGSTRLPGKVLHKICGKSIIQIIFERLQKVQNIDDIFLVTGTKESNHLLVNESEKLNLKYFCGSEENVLDRFYKASNEFNSENIIRITADCPLIDFNILNHGLEIYEKINCDILSIVRKRTFPHGFDFEIFRRKSLEESWKDNLSKYSNETEFLNTFIPPTKYMLEKKKFKNYDLVNKEDLSHIRLTLDYPEDFIVISKIYETLYKKNKYFTMNDILNFLNNNKKILDLNRKYINLNHELDIEK